MTILIISDLHLEESHPETAKIFFRFLNNEVKTATALYILGDFFETWIGDDNLSPFNLAVMTALKNTVQNGVPIYIMHGNRDFLIGKKFLKATGCRLLPDEYVVNLFGVPTLLMHGDTLCTNDIPYLKFRKKTRNWLFQKIFLLKSLRSRLAIANDYREKSKHHTAKKTDYIMDVSQTEVENVMQKNKVQHLIHGHTHRQNKHEFRLNKKPATRIVLGAWHGMGNALVCGPGGKREFITL